MGGYSFWRWLVVLAWTSGPYAHFWNLKVLYKNKSSKLKGWVALCGRRRWPASPDLGPLVLYGLFRKDYMSLSKERNRSLRQKRVWHYLYYVRARHSYKNYCSYNFVISVHLWHVKTKAIQQTPLSPVYRNVCEWPPTITSIPSTSAATFLSIP